MKDKFIFEEGDFYWGDVRSSEHYVDDPLVYDDLYILKANQNIFIQVSDKYVVHKSVEEKETSSVMGTFKTLNGAMTHVLKENQIWEQF